jgi:hypothetical protein
MRAQQQKEQRWERGKYELDRHGECVSENLFTSNATTVRANVNASPPALQRLQLAPAVWRREPLDAPARQVVGPYPPPNQRSRFACGVMRVISLAAIAGTCGGVKVSKACVSRPARFWR